VHGRWKFYDNRKNNIINAMKSGEKAELPEWSDDESIEEEEES